MGTGAVEEYRPGYPQFTALLAAYDPYVICRRFTKLRARLLLLKQDRLSVLEKSLEEIDQEEECPLFLGASRRDRNLERASLLSEVEARLDDYGEYEGKISMPTLLKQPNRSIHRKNTPDVESQPCSATRYREPAKLVRWQPLSG